MSAFTDKLPLELINLIIHHVAMEDKYPLLYPSIKACSLVSRSLLPHARSYLFSDITIGKLSDFFPGSSWIAFARLISQTPDIGFYVTYLSFAMWEREFDDLKDNNKNTESLARALNCLTRLQSLCLHVRISVSWKDLAVAVKESLLNLIHLPTLSCLRLHNLSDFQISDLTLCVGLKRLSVSSCNTEVGRSVEIYQEEPSRLESLNVGLSSRALLQLCTARRTDGKPVVDITGLRDLCVRIDQDNVNNTEESFKYLTQLTRLVILDDGKPLSCSTDLLVRPFLQTLQDISLRISYTPSFPLVAILASITGKNVIRSIDLSISFRESCWADSNTNGMWSALDQVFTGSNSESGWKELRSFSLEITVYYPSFEEDVEVSEELKLRLKSKLRGLASSKNIALDLHVYL